MGGAWKLRGYVVGELLGSGGSGDVWRAKVAATGEPVALKRIPTPEPEQARRAQQEAALLAQLDHPHLVRLHALVPTADACVLVLDLADGGSLADLLRARGRLSPGEVITAVAPVAAALAYLHDERVVHGDVSPANILFTPGGVALLADVGVARLTGDDADVLCTPAYVDPAVAAGSVPGPASDVFMLAGTAMHALTGAPPWPADNADTALALAARGDLFDVAARLAAAGVDAQMSAVLCRALSVDPHRRGAAADFALDLRHSGEPVAVELAAGRPRPVPTGPRHAARPPGVGPAAAADLSTAERPLHADPAQLSSEQLSSERQSSERAGFDRPGFERPTWPTAANPAAGAAPPTRLAGPRPRPVVPQPGKRRLGRRLSGRAVVVAVAVAVLALLGAGGAVWASGSWQAAEPHRPTRTSPLGPGASALRSSTTAATASTSGGTHAAQASGSTAGTGDTAAQAHIQAVLERLDAQRTAAFSTRHPDLLARVYVAGPLLRADTALLTRLVPTGCSLQGVRTHYSALTASKRGDRVLASVTASLAPSRLICRGQLRARAPGTGPTTLHLELVGTADGMRIASQQLG